MSKWSAIVTCPYCKRNQIVSLIQSTKKCIGCGRRFIGDAMYKAKFVNNVPFMLHQSDVIELLVGALRDALDKQPKWISVKDKLPENCVSVLVWAVYHNADGWDWTMPEIDSYYDMVGWDNTADPEAREVTHWMPLPTSPEANDA